MAPPKARPALPRSIWMLGLVSLLMDASSEMIHALLPMFLVSVLGATAVAVGLIEGVAEATAQIVKIFSGALSDAFGKRKPLVLFGYGLATLSKPLFPLATGVAWVATARFADRIGKGIRGAPRDALIADLTTPQNRGAAYGLRQSLDTVGAFVGPAAAVILMWALAGNFRLVLWIAVIPAILCVLLIWLGVDEPEGKARAPKADRPQLHWRELHNLGAMYWSVVAVAFAMTLARFSDAFLILRAQGVGVPIALAPLVMVLMNIAFGLASYPVGRLSDRADRRTLLLIGFGLLIAADLCLAAAHGAALLALGVVLWGLHMGFTQGLLAAMVADAAPEARRGSAFGLFYLASGIAMLLASAIAGSLWSAIGPSATFVAGAVFVSLATLGALLLRDNRAP